MPECVQTVLVSVYSWWANGRLRKTFYELKMLELTVAREVYSVYSVGFVVA